MPKQPTGQREFTRKQRIKVAHAIILGALAALQDALDQGNVVLHQLETSLMVVFGIDTGTPSMDALQRAVLADPGNANAQALAEAFELALWPPTVPANKKVLEAV